MGIDQYDITMCPNQTLLGTTMATAGGNMTHFGDLSKSVVAADETTYGKLVHISYGNKRPWKALPFGIKLR